MHDTFFVVRPDRSQLEQLAGLVDRGELRVQVREVRPLAEGARAYADRGLRAGRPGTTVLAVG